MKRALFLDRDGVINQDRGYVHRIEDFRFIDGIFDLGRRAGSLGYTLHVVTNQSGIGRGLYSEADFAILSAWMQARFAAEDAPIEAVHFCPNHPEHGNGAYRIASPRRKPAPGMMTDAAKTHGLDLSRSAMIGDKASDMQAADAAGVPLRILVFASAAEIGRCPTGCRLAADLRAAASLLDAA